MGISWSNAPGYIFGLGNDTTVLASGLPILLNTVNFNGGQSFLWDDNSTGPTLAAEYGIHWVEVTYGTAPVCTVRDTIEIKPDAILLAAPFPAEAFRSGASAIVTWQEPEGFPDAATFSVERSVAGEAFSTIGQAPGLSFTDPAPAEGENAYRIISTSQDGASYVSSIALLPPLAATANQVVYPNPCHGTCYATGLPAGDRYFVKDATGRLLASGVCCTGDTVINFPQDFTGMCYLYVETLNIILLIMVE